ncbi:MAG: polysulfide reductase NrfD [Gemmatimonadota bacterium]|jgi:Ni/Fe-hydrogenase subunit HybB-like protein
MAHHANSDVPVARFETLPAGLRIAIPALVLIGAAAMVGGVLVDPDRAWHAYLFNWLFFTGLAQGAVMLAVVVTIAKGMWSRTIRRIALSFVAFLPIAFLLLIPMLFVAPRIFPWIAEPVAGKEAYLNLPFLVIRQLVLLGLLFGVSVVFARAALRPDLGLIKAQMSGKLAALYDRMTRNWRGQEAEEAHAHQVLSKLAPALALLYALGMSVVAFDFVMSLEPHWFSTLIGPYFFMGAFLSGLAVTGVTTLAYVRKLGMADVVSASQFHDLGKLTFGFTVFWGYLFFSQFIVIWYGLLPGEQSFVVHRFTDPFSIIAKLVGIGVFVIPFFGLLGVAPKKNPRVLTLFGGISLFALWLERYLLVYPSYYMGAESLPLGWPEVGTALFFAGLMLGSLMWFATRFPIFQLWQPMSELELKGVEVPVEEPVAQD